MSKTKFKNLLKFASIVEEIDAKKHSTDVMSKLSSFADYLAESEAQLIDLMELKQPPKGGALEFGLVLYWIKHDLPKELRFVQKLFPQTKITPEQLKSWESALEAGGRVLGDGTLVGFGRYEQLDKGWLVAGILYVLSEVTDWVPKADFGSNPKVLTVESGRAVKIAIIGDWGTGEWSDHGNPAPSQQVMDQVVASNPDYTIHLGDVYYAGTGNLKWELKLVISLLEEKLGVPVNISEETDRLTTLWKAGSAGAFTLNSNHEMYSGAQGYFADALAVKHGPFEAQQNTSYFAILGPKWAVVGLDSAYFSTSKAYMQGRLQSETNSDQIQFVNGLDLEGKTTIAMTHHTALSYDAELIPPDKGKSKEETLWHDMKTAFNGAPDFWYWGHIHNAIVYNEKSPLGMEGTAARCVGHGAIPFGKAYVWKDEKQVDLDTLDSVSYYAKSALSNPESIPQWSNRVRNGFALLTLTDTEILEEIYEQGEQTPVWSNKVVC